MRVVTLLVLSLGFVLAGVVYLVWMNRASNLVVGAALPAVATLCSALALIFIFNRPAPVSRSFPVVFVVDRATARPALVPHRPFPDSVLALASFMAQKNPAVFQISQSDVGGLYHEFLQKAMVDDLAWHQSGAWRMKTERFLDLVRFEPINLLDDKATILSSEELETHFGENRFASVYSMLGKWALPPNTRLEINLPKNEPLSEGTIRLKNSYCEVTIKTVPTISVIGLGRYLQLTGLTIDQAQERYFTYQFTVNFEATFSSLLLGNPEMPHYRQWANALLEELSISFDEQSIWERARDQFLLRRHIESGSPVPPISPEPMQVTAPPEKTGTNEAAPTKDEKPDEKVKNEDSAPEAPPKKKKKPKD